MAIEVRYKCQCSSDEKKILLRERRDGQDVAEWMQGVARAVSDHHRAQSPHCLADKVEYLKIPSGENVPIGVKP